MSKISTPFLTPLGHLQRRLLQEDRYWTASPLLAALFHSCGPYVESQLFRKRLRLDFLQPSLAMLCSGRERGGWGSLGDGCAGAAAGWLPARTSCAGTGAGSGTAVLRGLNHRIIRSRTGRHPAALQRGQEGGERKRKDGGKEGLK